MRSYRLVIGLALTALFLGIAGADTQGYLAMYNVRYTNDATSGDLQGITISFDFDQWIFDYDPDEQMSTPHVFEDLKLNVTFPVTRNNGSTIFLTGVQQPSFVVIDHDVSLGDVSVGLYHYELDIDLPAVPFYCIVLDLPAEYLAFRSTETGFCRSAEMP